MYIQSKTDGNKHNSELQRETPRKKNNPQKKKERRLAYDITMTSQLKTSHSFIAHYSGINKFQI